MNIGKSFQTATDGFFGFLPNLLGFVVLLIVGFVVAKVVQSVARKVLQKLGLDRHLHQSDANRYVERVLQEAKSSGGEIPDLA